MWFLDVILVPHPSQTGVQNRHFLVDIVSLKQVCYDYNWTHA